MPSIYLDHSATTPVDSPVWEEMTPFFREIYGNPSSIHRFGQAARAAVEKARGQIAAALNARESDIYFVSGGTEADNLALQGVALARQSKGDHIITTRVEHKAVLETVGFLEKSGFQVTRLPVDSHGRVSAEAVRDAITDRTILISIIHGNNELGTLNPIGKIAQIARERGIYFHTDAVQTFGKVPIDVAGMNIDLLSVSGHKIYGPKGVGALYIRRGIPLRNLLFGGAQERNRRPGTENVPAIVGFGKAAEICLERMDGESRRLRQLRHHFLARVQAEIPDTELNGHPVETLPHIINLSFRGCPADALLLSLDIAGIAASAGSACTSGSISESHVLRALQLPRWRAESAIRFSLGRYTTQAELDQTVAELTNIVKRLRSLP